MRTKMAIGIASILVGSGACADDGYLYYNGAPRLMHGEAKIRMVREMVQVKIFATKAKVYCRFEFHNEGPATIARIGFPDGDTEKEMSNEYGGGSKLTSSMTSFRSRVDGKPIGVKLERGAGTGPDDAPIFQVKRVPFGAGQTRVIEDWYEQDSGGGITSIRLRKAARSSPDMLSGSGTRFTYIMYSGASWKGNIGEATVQVEFEEPKFQHLYAIPLAAKWKPPAKDVSLTSFLANRVTWSGFAYPTVDRNRLIFTRKNFKPTRRSDVSLEFDWTVPQS